MSSVTKRLWKVVWVWTAAVLFIQPLAPAIATAARSSKTIENISPRLHLAPVGTSVEQRVAAITAAAQDKGWRVVDEAPGIVTVILLRRSHEAVVTIGYDKLNFWIDYKDSVNLNYNPKDLIRKHRGKSRVVTTGPRIHPNYNIWVAALADQIVLRMQDPPEPSYAPPLLIADELGKLDKLRQSGALTQEEFDQQKARLLAR